MVAEDDPPLLIVVEGQSVRVIYVGFPDTTCPFDTMGMEAWTSSVLGQTANTFSNSLLHCRGFFLESLPE